MHVHKTLLYAHITIGISNINYILNLITFKINQSSIQSSMSIEVTILN